MVERLDRRRLVLVTDRFRSPHDGERLAALEAAYRLLESSGTTWRDIIEAPAEPAKPTKRKAPKGRQGEGATRSTEHAQAGPVADHAKLARTLLDKHADLLTQWEASFLHGIMAYDHLSPKQDRHLGNILNKCAWSPTGHGARS